MSNEEGGTAKRPSSALQSAIMLQALSMHGAAGLSVRTAADLVGTSRSAAHRLLQSLASAGFAVQDSQGSYTVGSRLVLLAAQVLSGSSPLSAAHDVMARLVDEVGETAYLAMLLADESQAMFVYRVECANPVRYVQPIGTLIPLDAGAAGKAILAHLDRGTAGASAELARELARVRELGFATSIQERIAGAAGVAAPVRSRSVVVGSLTVNVPTNRLPAEGLDVLGPVIAAYAEEISTIMTAFGATRL